MAHQHYSAMYFFEFYQSIISVARYVLSVNFYKAIMQSPRTILSYSSLLKITNKFLFM